MIREAAEEQNTDGSDTLYYLPGEVDGQKLTWRRAPERTGGVIAVFSLLAALLYGGTQVEKREEARRAREEEIQKDYPEIVSALVLLLGAGMSMRKALERLALDYQAGGETDGRQNVRRTKNCFIPGRKWKAAFRN